MFSVGHSTIIVEIKITVCFQDVYKRQPVYCVGLFESKAIIPYQQKNKRLRSRHLFLPDMVTTESSSAKHGSSAAAGFWSLLYRKYSAAPATKILHCPEFAFKIKVEKAWGDFMLCIGICDDNREDVYKRQAVYLSFSVLALIFIRKNKTFYL